MSFLSKNLSIENTYIDEPNVVSTVKKIMSKLVDEEEILCCAEMQSGKSEVMKRIVYMVNKYYKKLSTYLKYAVTLNRIFIIVSTSSIGLKTQLREHIPIISNNIFHINDIISILSSKGKYVEKSKNILKDMSTNSIIIFDECHADVEINSTVSQLRDRLNIVNKDSKNRYKVIGFSATPYEQIYYDVEKVIMEPGPNYYGIREIYKNKKIKQAYDLRNESDIYKLFLENPIGNFYYIFRLPADTSIYDQTIESVRKIYIDVSKNITGNNSIVSTFVYDKDDKYDINRNLLNIVPKTPIFIFLKDKMRMGCYLNTKHIALVHDDHTNQYAHTTIQSLLGRCCGYNKSSHSVNIYCDKSHADEHYDWVLSNYDKDKIPSRIKYLNKSCIYN